MNFEFVVFCVLLALGLSMDACASSMSIGLDNPFLKRRQMFFVAGVFGVFQGLFEFAGFALFSIFSKKIEAILPFVALVVLVVLGTKMIVNGAKKNVELMPSFSAGVVIVQGVATSVDAFSAGVSVANFAFLQGLASSVATGAITFVLCFCAIIVGKKFGQKLGFGAQIAGGTILILIGVVHFLKGIL